MEHFEMMFDDGGMDRSYTAGFKMFAPPPLPPAAGASPGLGGLAASE